MAALPYMQLYVADYLADTAYLDVIESGAYLHLLMNYWQTGKPLPDDDKKLARISKCTEEQWLNVRSAVVAFFVEQDGFLYNNRVERDLLSVLDKQTKASLAGKASAEARRIAKLNAEKQAKKKARSTSVEQTLNHTDTDTDTDTDKKEKELPPAVLSFSESFYDHISKNGGKKNHTTKEIAKGANTVDKLIRIDKYNLEDEIKPALLWGLNDNFWSKQIRSLSPLRAKSKNGETKFTNLFNQFSARGVKDTNKKGNTLDEFQKMVGGLGEKGDCDLGTPEGANNTGTAWPLGLPLPK